MGRTLVVLCVLIGIPGLIILLQAFLSKQPNRWLGLILPGISFIYSLMIVAALSTFTILPTTITQSVTITQNGEVIEERSEEIINNDKYDKKDTLANIMSIILTFVISNVPTLILLAIYKAYQDKQKRKLALEKMNIQDLE